MIRTALAGLAALALCLTLVGCEESTGENAANSDVEERPEVVEKIPTGSSDIKMEKGEGKD